MVLTALIAGASSCPMSTTWAADWRFFRVTDPEGKLRFESLRIEDAVGYVQELYDKHGYICNVAEVRRSQFPWPNLFSEWFSCPIVFSE